MAAIADSASFRTNGYRRDLARRLGLTGFGAWWAEQLAALMPGRLRAALEKRRTRPVLAFDGSRATLWRPAPANGRIQMTAVAEIPLYADQEIVRVGGRNAFAPLLRAANGGAPEIVVALSPRNALRKRLTLPAAIEPNLHQALAYDLDRHTPFKADELYFDAAVVDRDTARNTVQVDLAAARRAVVDPMLRHAENFGARVVAVTIDPPATAAASRLNLLPEERRAGDAHWLRWQVVLPAILLGAGIIAALVLPVWQKRMEAIALNQQADDARQRAQVSDSLRSELDRRVGDYNFALERKYAFPGTVQVLDDITHILPDDTWLTQLELRSVRGKDGQRELTLRGESANAGRLVSLLEDSKLFTQTAPRSPTTKIQPGPGEIFDVGAQLKPMPAPTPMPLDVTAAPPTPPRAAGGPPPSAAAPSLPPVSTAAPASAPAAPGAVAPAPPAGAMTANPAAPAAASAAVTPPPVTVAPAPAPGAGSANPAPPAVPPAAVAAPPVAAPQAAPASPQATPASTQAAPASPQLRPGMRFVPRSMRTGTPQGTTPAAPAAATGSIGGASQAPTESAPLEPPANEPEQPAPEADPP